MSRWIKHIKLKDLLDEFDDDADELKEIERVIPLWRNRFQSIQELKHLSKIFNKVKTLNQFNKKLNIVYDFCDSERIWIN